ncbi:flagellar biosynthesis protein FliQ [Methyloversatilis universalis]|uniref:flagellar biosynthesis protein FliQ n=1 Tax=Methyloversatilis universalis TaxID=378211 RepID=UPI00037FFF28|nr:flagellar biosynthesis protein FliQ [Methyloversatilis universalis]
MTPTTVVDIGRDAVEVLLIVSAPMLGAALVTGLLVSIFQAATQVNEMTLSFIPKLIAVFVVIIVGGPWMITLMTEYIRRLYSSIPSLIG